MPSSSFIDPNLVLILQAFSVIVAALVAMNALINTLIFPLFGAQNKPSLFKEAFFVLGGMAIIIASFMAIKFDFDLIYIYAFVSLFPFAPLYGYKAYMKGSRYIPLIKLLIYVAFLILILSIIYYIYHLVIGGT